MNDNLGTALLVVLCIDAALLLGQAAILDMNDQGPKFFDCNNATASSYTDCASKKFNSAAGLLPGDATTVDPSSGSVFTDIFQSIKGWLNNFTLLFKLLSAPMNMLQIMGLPDVLSFVIGTIWYGINLFLIVAFLKG